MLSHIRIKHTTDYLGRITCYFPTCRFEDTMHAKRYNGGKLPRQEQPRPRRNTHKAGRVEKEGQNKPQTKAKTQTSQEDQDPSRRKESAAC